MLEMKIVKNQVNLRAQRAAAASAMASEMERQGGAAQRVAGAGGAG
jgi:hypothetical protein